METYKTFNKDKAWQKQTVNRQTLQWDTSSEGSDSTLPTEGITPFQRRAHPMPKDLTKLSLKDFEALANGDIDKRFNWNRGTLEMTVSKAGSKFSYEEEDAV